MDIDLIFKIAAVGIIVSILNQVLVRSGREEQATMTSLAALVDPGDEVIVPAPYWVSYYEMVRLFGGVPVVVNVSEEQGFQLTPEQLEHAITDKTKAIILNNPSNPTGAVYPKEALKAVADVWNLPYEPIKP